MAKLLRSEGLLTIVFGRLDDPIVDKTKADLPTSTQPDPPKAIDDDRYKQLLTYFNQVLRSRGHSALTYFQSLDLDKDGRISGADFRKGLRDVGVTDVESKEINLVYKRIEGAASVDRAWV